jgi:hypothetical protein
MLKRNSNTRVKEEMQFRNLNETIIDAPYTFANLKKLLEIDKDE